MKKIVWLIGIVISWISLSYAQIKLNPNTIIAFATVEEGREILTAQDDFVLCMSPFDRASRVKTKDDVIEKDYLEFVSKNVLAWNDDEKKKIITAFQGVQAKLEELALPFPEKVFFIKTTGREEGGAAYTRANAVIFPEANLTANSTMMQKLIAHELFHILTRANPELREKLYAAIGFVKCNDVFLVELKSRKITNPDAPRNDHCIRLRVGLNDQWAVPILYSKTEKYDVKQGGDFFNYLQFQFLLVERDDKSFEAKPIYEDQKPKLIDLNQASGFFEQVGKNTQYIIHPEEILADNFSLLVLQKSKVQTPVILKKIEEILKEAKHKDTNSSADAETTPQA